MSFGEAGEWRRVFTDTDVEWDEIERTMKEALNGPFEGEAYGFSKACVNAYSQWLAKQYPALVVNSCTPGFIATDLTKVVTRLSFDNRRPSLACPTRLLIPDVCADAQVQLQATGIAGLEACLACK